MTALAIIDLMRNFNKGNTIRLVMQDESSYVVNNAQYKMSEFVKLIQKKIENYSIIWDVALSN